MKNIYLNFLFLLFAIAITESKEVIDLGEFNESSKTNVGYEKLIEKLGNARIVFVGEQSHGVGTEYENFANIVKLLHEELNFNIIAEEFCFFTIDQINKNDNFSSSQEYRKAMYWPQGLAKENDKLFDYIDSCKNTANPIRVEGIDPRIFQRDTYHSFIDSLINSEDYSEIIDIDSKEKFLLTLDNLLKYEYKDTITTAEEKHTFINTINSLLEATEGKNRSRKNQILRSLIGFAQNAWNPSEIDDNDVDRFWCRSKQMAENLIWLSETKYPTEKIIVRAHIGHSSKNLKSLEGFIPGRFFSDSLNLGSLIHNKYGNKSFHIGTTYYSGTFCNWEYKPIEIPVPSKESLEYELHNSGLDYSFVTLEQGEVKGMFYGDFNSYSQDENWQAPFGLLFDGIIFINEVKLPTKKQLE